MLWHNRSMKEPRISAIASIGENRELGKGGRLLWRISDDLKRVKTLTTGHPIIMGRKTYESIGRPLPNRTNIIVTHDASYHANGCVVVHSLEAALAHARTTEKEEVFIFGGAQIYEEAMPQVGRLYLTVINASDPEADTSFPDYSSFTNIIEKEAREQEGLAYSWLTLERS